MRGRLHARLAQLKAEYAEGRRRLEALDRQHHELSQTVLRISGAIQVLEEELAAREDGDATFDGEGTAVAVHEGYLSPG